MGLLQHVRLGLDNVESTAASPTTTTTTTEAACAVPSVKDGDDGKFLQAVGEALRMIGEYANNPAVVVNNGFFLEFRANRSTCWIIRKCNAGNFGAKCVKVDTLIEEV